MADPGSAVTEQSGNRTLRATALVEGGYHELGFWYPGLRLRELGAHLSVAGPAADHAYLRVLVLAESQYQELELWYPVLRFRAAGADVVVASPLRGALYASKIGYPVRSDCSVDEIAPADVDVLIIPGGFAPEGMRRSQPLLDLVRKAHG